MLYTVLDAVPTVQDVFHPISDYECPQDDLGSYPALTVHP